MKHYRIVTEWRCWHDSDAPPAPASEPIPALPRMRWKALFAAYAKLHGITMDYYKPLEYGSGAKAEGLLNGEPVRMEFVAIW